MGGVRTPLALAAAAEIATGLVLLAYPPIVVGLLLGADISGPDDTAAVAVVIGRVAGIALIALGVGCWPGSSALAGMLTYGSLVTIYLGGLGLTGNRVGALLWPAVALHVVLSVLLAVAWLRQQSKVS
jgi:hypothetical protein